MNDRKGIMLRSIVKYAIYLVFWGSCSFALAQKSSLYLYDQDFFTNNPEPEDKSHGFYFFMDAAKKIKKYPNSCDEFYQLWEMKNAQLNIETVVFSQTFSQYNWAFSGCLLSKWADFSKIDTKDNIINQTNLKKVTSILPASINYGYSEETPPNVKYKSWHDVSPDFRPINRNGNMVEFKNNRGAIIEITFYGTTPDAKMGKVYPILVYYTADCCGNGTNFSAYLLGKDINDKFFIIRGFPELDRTMGHKIKWIIR